jgi:cell division protease FtsH
MQEKEKQTIAYHELGHAVTSHLLPEADKVEKITIVRR